MELAWQIEIIAESSAARQQPFVFLPQHRPAYSKLHPIVS
jgi:hypothetical protein